MDSKSCGKAKLSEVTDERPWETVSPPLECTFFQPHTLFFHPHTPFSLCTLRINKNKQL